MEGVTEALPVVEPGWCVRRGQQVGDVQELSISQACFSQVFLCSYGIVARTRLCPHSRAQLSPPACFACLQKSSCRQGSVTNVSGPCRVVGSVLAWYAIPYNTGMAIPAYVRTMWYRYTCTYVRTYVRTTRVVRTWYVLIMLLCHNFLIGKGHTTCALSENHVCFGRIDGSRLRDVHVYHTVCTCVDVHM